MPPDDIQLSRPLFLHHQNDGQPETGFKMPLQTGHHGQYFVHQIEIAIVDAQEK